MSELRSPRGQQSQVIADDHRRRSSSISTSEDETFLDYDSVSSPGSTTSEPTYIRPAGFEHHAQEILAERLKNIAKLMLLSLLAVRIVRFQKRISRNHQLPQFCPDTVWMDHLLPTMTTQ